MQNDWKQDKAVKIVLIIITMIQICAMIYAVHARGGFHIDEFYSHGLMQYDNAFIINDEDFFNEWHDKEYYKKYLTVKSDEMWDFTNVYKNQILDVHPPIYYLLLRVATMFHLDNFSVWPGSILNIILFVFSTIVLYKIGNKLFQNKWYSVILCLMNGFCVGVIETVMLMRMYQFMTLNVLLILNWHLCKKDKELEKKDLIQLGTLIVIGFLTHYYYAIIVAGLYFMYMIQYAKKKQKNNMIKYTATIMIAVLTAIVIFPYCIQHIFFGYRGQQSFQNVGHFNIYWLRIKGYAKIINEHILSGQYIFFAIILLLAIYTIMSKKWRKQKIDSSQEIQYVLIPAIWYTAVITIISVYIDFRYIMPVIPLYICLLVYALKLVLEEILNKKAIYAVAIIGMIYCAYHVPKIGNNLYTYKNNATFIQAIQKDGIQTSLLVDELLPIKYSSIMTMYDFLISLNETYVIEPKNVNTKKVKEIFQDKDTKQGVLLIGMRKDLDKILPELLNAGVFNQAKSIATTSRYELIILK